MDIDDRLKFIINEIEDLGYETLIVGGAVRNHLLNLKINDYDLATAASLSEVLQAFLQTKIIYRDNLVWAVKVNYQGFNTEVSTFRIEKDYFNRVPRKIIYVNSFKEDVLRRDFTINAIAYSLKNGFIDYTGGIKDIKNKLIKVIGNPQLRFNEDPIRILRAIRLASTLNFKIEAKTLFQIKQMYPLAFKIKSEHIANELKKTLAGNNFDYVYLQVTNLFLDISNNQFENKPLRNRRVLLDDNNLFVYLRYVVNLSLDNDLFSVLNINKSIIKRLDKLDKLISMLLVDISYEKMVMAFIDYNKDNLDYIVNILADLEIITANNLSNYQQISSKGYLKIDDLAVDINDITADLSINQKYQILITLQKEVILDKINNQKDLLQARIIELINKEKPN